MRAHASVGQAGVFDLLRQRRIDLLGDFRVTEARQVEETDRGVAQPMTAR